MGRPRRASRPSNFGNSGNSTGQWGKKDGEGVARPGSFSSDREEGWKVPKKELGGRGDLTRGLIVEQETRRRVRTAK